MRIYMDTRGLSTIHLALFVVFKDAPGRSINNVVDISRYSTKTRFVDKRW